VTAEGVPAELGAVEIDERADEPGQPPEFVAARQEVERLEREIALLDEQEKAAAEMRGLLGSIKAVSGQQAGEGLAEGRVDPQQVRGMYELIETKLGELGRAVLERQAARRRLTEELAVARARLAAARPAGAIRSRVVSVEVVAQRAGSLTLRLACVVPGAAWRPSYRAMLGADAAGVALVSEAVVRQSTGEDWSGVALRLSTAAPARGVEPPLLDAAVLRPIEVVESLAKAEAVHGARARIYQGVQAPAGAPEDSAIEADGAGGFVEVRAREAGVVHSAYNVAFEVPGRSDVPADGGDHRVVLRQENLTGKLVYRTVPALNPAAYMTLVTRAPEGYPLLAGPVRVFAAGAFLGSFALAETGPKAELTLPFGVDNRIKVERVRLPQEHSLEGLGGKTRQVAYAFRTTVENLRGQALTLVLEDRIPVAEDARIEVEVKKETTPGYTESERRPGVLLWTLDLAPREKRELLLSYTVRFPKDMTIAGLE
jgi:uncharacterized protein (TIGR02231 family)